MANNVVRKDVIEIGFKTDMGSLNKLTSGMDNLKKSVSSVGRGDGLDEIKKQAKNASSSVNSLNSEAKKTTGSIKAMANVSVDKLTNGLKNMSTHLKDIAKKASGAAYNGLKKLAGISFKALAAGLGGAATAIAAVVKKSVQSFGDYEQLVGGVETLFGTGGAKTVEEYANSVGKSVAQVQTQYNSLKASENKVLENSKVAYKTAGLSANDYMETVTSFSASLLQSVGGDTMKAAEKADTAIVDMSDNANKMGTSMEFIKNAYQGFAKQNYTMLDNLKLGYGGTKEEMERLLADAGKLANKKFNLNNLSDVFEAIHIIQTELGITKTTEKEAATTIQGSFNSMKAAWSNMLTALVTGGNDYDTYVDNLIGTVGTFGKNIMPVIEKSLSGVGKLAEDVAPIIEEKLPELVDTLLPPLIKAATSLLKGFIKALPNIIKSFAGEIPNIVKQVGEGISEAFGDSSFLSSFGNFFSDNAKSISKFVPLLLGLVVALKAVSGASSKIGSISNLFGKSGKSGGSENGSGSMLGGLTNTFKTLANTNTKVILKGISNLAIIIGGLTLIAVVLMALAPYMAKLTDTKSFLKLVAAIGILGLVGTALAKLASLVGNIPVATVAKGLANIAIILGGMTVLFLIIGATSLINFDLSKILKIVAIIGVIGVVGAALAGLAGLIGLIPIPVVLAGLANIALVIGGMTALILAYGALSEIPNFNEFLSKGGDTLANLFTQIGKIAGSLIGGIGEGISASLPKIGENLTAFANAVSPMFQTFSGVDMSGVANFFSSLGSFMLQMAGNDLISIFTGGSDLATVGTDLTNFANNASGFFSTVALLPAAGFTNASLLFQSLADIGNVPKTGGLVQWFSGETDFAALSDGLTKLTSEGVVSFFNTVSTLPQAGFDNAKNLFQSLADIGNVPKSGGLKQWFTGENDFAGLSEKLPPFGEAMAKFYTSISSIEDFTKISQLFEALAKIDEAVPKKGGVAQLFSGESNLSVLGEELKAFGDSASGFFTQVNTLDVSKMDALWDSLKKSEEVTAGISGILDERINDLVGKISMLPTKMADGIKNSGQSLSDAFVTIWVEAVNACVSPVNKLISGANWILKQFGSDKVIASWTPYAKGTNGHKGGNALVNDGSGAELVQMPNGNAFIPKGRNVLIPNAPKGMKVLPADQTAQLMGKGSATFRYAKGTGKIDIWDYVDNASGLISKVADKYVTYGKVKGFALSAGKSMVSTIQGEMSPWAKKLYDEYGALSIANYVASKGVEQWRSTVIRALKMENQYSEDNVKRTLYQMQTESGGNPRAINLWDSNAKKGIPSKGLMQVIDPTFKSYARAGFDKNIYDPLSNILASIRYAVARYGSLAKAYQGHGYANGGIATKPSIFGENGAEMAIPLKASKRKRGLSLWGQAGSMLGVNYGSYSPESDGENYQSSNSVENNTYAPVFNLTISGTNDDRTMARKVKQWISEALDETFDSLYRQNKRIQEI